MYEPFIEFALEQWRDRLLPRWGEYCERMEALCHKDCTIGMIGLQSAGKSTLLNTCLGYPLLPSLMTKGTTCPVFVEWGERPALTARLRQGARKRDVSLPLRLSGETFEALLEYVCFCVNQKVFFPENLSYFLRGEQGVLSPENLELHPDDLRHTLLLMLILLNAHIDGTDGIGTAFRQAAEMRKSLLRTLMRDEGNITGLHFTWNAAALRNGVRLLDLPGLGSGGEKDFLSAVAMAQQADVLLCLTTKETVLGDLERALDAVYRQSNPLPVLVVNKAEEISNAEIVINSARQMLWPRQSACYLVSAITGEAQYLSQGICVEHTRYWREVALPEFLKFSKGAVAGESLKAAAARELSECFYAKYPCVGQNGDPLSLSMDEFMKNVLPQLARQGELRRFCTVFQSDARAAERLKQLTEEEFLFFSKVLKNPDCLWNELTQMCVSVFAELEAACGQAQRQLYGIRENYQAFLQLFLKSWSASVDRLNRSFFQAAREKCARLPSCLGLGICRENDNAFLREMRELFDALDCGAALKPALDIYADAVHQAAEGLIQAVARLRNAAGRCTEALRQVPDRVFQTHENLGYDPTLLSRYYGKEVDTYVEDALKTCEKMFAPVELRADVRPAALDFHWREYGWAFVWECIRGAVLWRGAGVFMLRKRRLMERFSEPLIPSVMSDQLLHPFLCPEPEKDAVGRIGALIQTCEVLKKATVLEKEKLKRQAAVLSLTLREVMISDFDKLRGWKTMVSNNS